MKRTNTTPVEVSLHTNFGVSLGNKMFKNEVFEKRIHDVQKKIEELKESNSPRSPQPRAKQRSPLKKAATCIDESKVDQFYAEMAKFYEKPPKHESPTRRLRQQINTAFSHKGFLSQ